MGLRGIEEFQLSSSDPGRRVMLDRFLDRLVDVGGLHPSVILAEQRVSLSKQGRDPFAREGRDVNLRCIGDEME